MWKPTFFHDKPKLDNPFICILYKEKIWKTIGVLTMGLPLSPRILKSGFPRVVMFLNPTNLDFFRQKLSVQILDINLQQAMVSITQA